MHRFPLQQQKHVMPAKIWLDHLKSFRNRISQFSAPTQAKLVDAGFAKVFQTTMNGLSIKVFSQFEGPVNKILRYLPFSNSILHAVVNSSKSIPFRCIRFSDISSHCRLQFLHSIFQEPVRVFPILSTYFFKFLFSFFKLPSYPYCFLNNL